MNNPIRRRWFRFGIRGLLLLTAAIAMASPWLPSAYRRFFPRHCPECGYVEGGPLLHGAICEMVRQEQRNEVRHFVPGPEFKLAREAAAQRAYAAEKLQEQE